MARKILLADDSVTAQNMGRKILTDAGYEVVTVNNGSAALKKIFEVKPDLIVLDVYMPGYSGLEVCQRIKENKDSSRIPILLTVGKLEPFKPEEARRVRADAFVVKPFEASELLAALARLEDKIVPQAEPYKQGRFAKAVAAVDDQVAVDKDETWKARLRIPTGDPKPEPPSESEIAVPAKTFRDFHAEDSGKHEPRRESVFERPIPAGLPADITPEEIAAITAAAAQLHGSAASPRPTESEPAPAPTVASSETSSVTNDEPSPVTFASSPEAAAAPVGMSLAETGEPTNPTESGSEPAVVAVAPETPAATDSPEVVESQASSAQETPHVTTPSESASIPDTPAPVEVASEAIPATTASDPASSATDVAAASEVTADPAPQPADDEVMAALQSLMPANTAVEPLPTASTHASDPTNSALAAIASQVDSSVLKAHAAGPRWIAEEVALADNEATTSLEREMEQAYAAVAASGTVVAASAAAVAEKSVPPIAIGNPAERSAVVNPLESNAAESAAAYAMAAGAAETATVAAPAREYLPTSDMARPEPVHEIAGSAAPASAPLADEDVPVAASPQTLPDTHTSEGVEDMAASWKNIRDSIATGGAVKAAPGKEKEETSSADPANSEFSAAPAAEAPVSSASDPKAIASIVDSVLAELRPKIVEEIARKLADSKKE